MKKIFANQVGFKCDAKKTAVLNFGAETFLIEKDGKEVFKGQVKHFGKDDISGEDTYTADFSSVTEEGTYVVKADGVSSCKFEISKNPYEKLMKDMLKTYYFLRCGDALEEKYAGVYMHKPCHLTKAFVFGEEEKSFDVSGGWHDAGDYGRYSTAGSVAVAHLLYAVRFNGAYKKFTWDIPKDKTLPDILAEVKVELDFLMKMQKEDGSVWHKVTTMNHPDFIMPEDDHGKLLLFHASSLATADVAAVFALAYTVYKEYDKDYADKLMEKSLKAYEWLSENPEELLFYNPEGSNTGQYDEAEDISNRFWAAASLYDATGDEMYLREALFQKERLVLQDKEATHKGYIGNVFTCLGWAEVAGLGSMALILKGGNDKLTEFVKDAFISEGERLIEVTKENGFGLCMKKTDFIWGSNMELGKYLMILYVANTIKKDQKYTNAIQEGFDYLLGKNSMDTSYVTGNGEKAYKNPHLRPTAVDNIEDPWPGLVSGGPNVGLQDERAKEVPKDSAPMKCYLDHVDCYSLNEITIYWNSPFVFALAGIM